MHIKALTIPHRHQKPLFYFTIFDSISQGSGDDGPGFQNINEKLLKITERNYLIHKGILLACTDSGLYEYIYGELIDKYIVSKQKNDVHQSYNSFHYNI